MIATRLPRELKRSHMSTEKTKTNDESRAKTRKHLLSAAIEITAKRLIADTDQKGLVPRVLSGLCHAIYLFPEEPALLLCMEATVPVFDAADAVPTAKSEWAFNLESEPAAYLIAYMPDGDVEHIIVACAFILICIDTTYGKKERRVFKELRLAFAVPRYGYKTTLSAEQRNLIAQCLDDAQNSYEWRHRMCNLEERLNEQGTHAQISRTLKNLIDLIDTVDGCLAGHLDEVLESGPYGREHYVANLTPLGSFTELVLPSNLPDKSNAFYDSDDDSTLYSCTLNDECVGAQTAPSVSKENEDGPPTSTWSDKQHSTVLSRSILSRPQRKALGVELRNACSSAELTLINGNALTAQEVAGLTCCLAMLKPCNPNDPRLLDGPLFVETQFPDGKFIARSVFRAPSQYIPEDDLAALYTSPVTEFRLELPEFVKKFTTLLYATYGPSASLRALFASTGVDPEEALTTWLQNTANLSMTPVISLRSFANELREFATAEFDLPLHSVYCLFAAPNHMPTTDSYYASITVTRLRHQLLEIVDSYLAGDSDV